MYLMYSSCLVLQKKIIHIRFHQGRKLVNKLHHDSTFTLVWIWAMTSSHQIPVKSLFRKRIYLQYFNVNINPIKISQKATHCGHISLLRYRTRSDLVSLWRLERNTLIWIQTRSFGESNLSLRSHFWARNCSLTFIDWFWWTVLIGRAQSVLRFTTEQFSGYISSTYSNRSIPWAVGNIYEGGLILKLPE